MRLATRSCHRLSGEVGQAGLPILLPTTPYYNSISSSSIFRYKLDYSSRSRLAASRLSGHWRRAGWPRHRFGCLGDEGTRGIERRTPPPVTSCCSATQTLKAVSGPPRQRHGGTLGRDSRLQSLSRLHRPGRGQSDPTEATPPRLKQNECPNCHAVLHRREPPYSLDEVRGLLQACRS